MKLSHFLIALCFSFVLLPGCQSDGGTHNKELFNESAALTKVNGKEGVAVPLDWHMITMVVDIKRKETAVLYGNDVAFEHAKSAGGEYPPDAKLALVTWLEKPDIHWFGANIPGSIRSIEEIVIERNKNGKNIPVYSKLIGQALVEPQNTDSLKVAKSINFMLQLRRPYLPD